MPERSASGSEHICRGEQSEAGPRRGFALVAEFFRESSLAELRAARRVAGELVEPRPRKRSRFLFG